MVWYAEAEKWRGNTQEGGKGPSYLKYFQISCPPSTPPCCEWCIKELRNATLDCVHVLDGWWSEDTDGPYEDAGGRALP